MAEYIEREALLADFDAAVDNNGMGYVIGQTLKRYVKRQPAADVVEVKHGRWAWNGKCWECSNCRCNRFHDLVLGLDAAYCGHCGARMDGE